MKRWSFNCTYTARGYLVVEAKTEEEAKAKAKKFDTVHDEVTEASFEDVDLETCEADE